MTSPQAGIFAIGTAAHVYLELEATGDAVELVRVLACLEEPHLTVAGTNFVIGFRPELWSEICPGGLPDDVSSFAEPIRGTDGFEMPATQADAWIWISGSARDAVFDAAHAVLVLVRDRARVVRELDGWDYQHGRDLTGFIDGTENPSLLEAPTVALVPEGRPGEGGSILLFQEWPHDRPAWQALEVDAQERVIGRTKSRSVELDDDVMPEDSHVSRTVVEVDGEELAIFRRNTPYGGITTSGTVFIGFSSSRQLLHRMLERMAGAEDGIRDRLTHYTHPVSGAYYFVPSVEAMRSIRG